MTFEVKLHNTYNTYGSNFHQNRFKNECARKKIDKLP